MYDNQDGKYKWNLGSSGTDTKNNYRQADRFESEAEHRPNMEPGKKT
jgi:hypothetical protein